MRPANLYNRTGWLLAQNCSSDQFSWSTCPHTLESRLRNARWVVEHALVAGGVTPSRSSPGINGFDVLRKVRENPRLRTVPVFILTAKELTDQEAELLKRETRGLFQKHSPWRENLLSQIRQAINEPIAAS